jgi:hypothetical protein
MANNLRSAIVAMCAVTAITCGASAGGDGGPFPRSAGLQSAPVVTDTKPLTQLLRDFVESKATIHQIAKSKLPPDAASAIAKWISDKNIPIDDPGTTSRYYSLKIKGAPDAFLGDFSGSVPTDFRITVVVRSGSVIGESIQVAT